MVVADPAEPVYSVESSCCRKVHVPVARLRYATISETRFGTGGFRDRNFLALDDEADYRRAYSYMCEASGNFDVGT